MGIAIELALLAMIAYTPFGNAFFGTAPIPLSTLLVPIPFAILIFLFGEIRKLLIRRKVVFVEKYLRW